MDQKQIHIHMKKKTKSNTASQKKQPSVKFPEIVTRTVQDVIESNHGEVMDILSLAFKSGVEDMPRYFYYAFQSFKLSVVLGILLEKMGMELTGDTEWYSSFTESDILELAGPDIKERLINQGYKHEK